ncbi:MAG: DinB family protein [Acidobacteriota bacterium]
MNAERRAAIVRILEESSEAFHAAVGAVPEDRVRFTPGPDRWCVLEIVEHVALAERGMFQLLKTAAADPANEGLERPEREAFISSVVANREKRGQAPERARPLGRFTTVPEGLRQFAAARQATILFARETPVDLFRVTATHPLFGPVNGYEMLLIMAGHPRRHGSQIEELMQHSKPDTAPRE